MFRVMTLLASCNQHETPLLNPAVQTPMDVVVTLADNSSNCGSSSNSSSSSSCDSA